PLPESGDGLPRPAGVDTEPIKVGALPAAYERATDSARGENEADQNSVMSRCYRTDLASPRGRGCHPNRALSRRGTSSAAVVAPVVVVAVDREPLDDVAGEIGVVERE